MTLGFVILRHVNNTETDRYWKICYERVRKYYPKSDIVIIDDNSNYKLVDMVFQNGLYKTTVIRSMWAGRGELLPYFYYVSYGWFDTAVILHDSVFINKYIDFEEALSNGRGYRFLWEFGVKQDSLYMSHRVDEVKLLRRLGTCDVDKLLEFHRGNEWIGCFGAMSVVTLTYLKKVNLLFPLENLLDGIVGRFNRMSFERIVACIFQYIDKSATIRCEKTVSLDDGRSLFGNIFKYCKFGISFNNAIVQNNLPMIKAWTGR